MLDIAKQQLELFSAYAEVFLNRNKIAAMAVSFLCLRRGVSRVDPEILTRDDFSLPTQRCFSMMTRASRRCSLFSAYAEVFPFSLFQVAMLLSFLCLRRGVS